MNELSVCVVDDDQYFNSLVRAIIEQRAAANDQPVKVSSYNSGYECMKYKNKADLVFLDFYLSTKNDITHTGLDVLKKLKTDNPGTKVVFMSQVHDWAQFKDELIAEGAMDFIKKDERLPENIGRILQQTQKI